MLGFLFNKGIPSIPAYNYNDNTLVFSGDIRSYIFSAGSGNTIMFADRLRMHMIEDGKIDHVRGVTYFLNKIEQPMHTLMLNDLFQNIGASGGDAGYLGRDAYNLSFSQLSLISLFDPHLCFTLYCRFFYIKMLDCR
jgi:hypothetical protein